MVFGDFDSRSESPDLSNMKMVLFLANGIRFVDAYLKPFLNN